MATNTHSSARAGDNLLHGTRQAITDVPATAPTDAINPATRYHRALSAFNGGTLSEEEYQAAIALFDQWEPVTPIELIQKLTAMCADGATPNHDRIRLLAEQAESLISGARSDGGPTAGAGDEAILSAFRRWQEASAAYSIGADDEDDEHERLRAIYKGAEESIRSTIATTPAGVAAKLWIALNFEKSDIEDLDATIAADLGHFTDDVHLEGSDQLILSALRSLEAMGDGIGADANTSIVSGAPTVVARWPGSTLRQLFEAWRAAYEAHALAGGSPDEIAAPLCKASYDAAGALVAAPCASPDDFLIKAYVNLLCEHGYALYDDADLNGDGNFWDIDIQQADHPTYLTAAWARSAYHDLDMSDLGACLLAFGRLDFSAEDWLRRARALEVPISLTVAGPNEWSLHVGKYAGDGDCDRRRRECARLERLLEFDPPRRQAVIDLLAADPVERFWRAFDEFNAGGGSEEECTQASDFLDQWAPATPRDFVRKFETMFSEGGAPTEERVSILVNQAVALLGGERSGR